MLAAGIAIAMAFCGLSSIASAGRMLYAFSRDDGVPGSGWLKKVSRTIPDAGELADRDRGDRVAVHGRGVLRRAEGPPSSSSRPSARSSCTPRTGSCIYLGATTQDWLKERVWSLGRWSKPIAWIALAWVLVLMVLFSFPTSGNISWPFMVVTVLFLLVYYFALGAAAHSRVRRSMGDSAELTEIEREFSHEAEKLTTA